ncbi:hypothetical protein ACHAWF_006488 [Thalassiosira exigua]
MKDAVKVKSEDFENENVDMVNGSMLSLVDAAGVSSVEPGPDYPTRGQALGQTSGPEPEAGTEEEGELGEDEYQSQKNEGETGEDQYAFDNTETRTAGDETTTNTTTTTPGDSDMAVQYQPEQTLTAMPGAFRVYPFGGPSANAADTTTDEREPQDYSMTQEGSSPVSAEELARVLGIPMVQATAVDPGVDPEADEEGGRDVEVEVSRNSLPSSPPGIDRERNDDGLGGDHGDVIQAKAIPTITVCGRSIHRSTARYGLSMVALIAVIVAIAVPLALNSARNGDISQEEDPAVLAARERQYEEWRTLRRTALAGALSPMSREGAFDGDGLNASAPRISALEWLVDDFPKNVSTLDEMIDHYPEWKMRQRYALALLYFSTNGPGWYSQLSFVSNKSECSWAGKIIRLQGDKIQIYNEDGSNVEDGVVRFNQGGVTCDVDERVDTITLGVNNLMGTIPEEISYFNQSLLKLGLMRNTLSSTIPESLGELKKLQRLNLMENCLTGEIPQSLPGLSMLSEARFVGNNQLRGDLNGFCNGTQYRENAFDSEMFIAAECGDCPGSMTLVECECCTCCSYNEFTCCDEEGTPNKQREYAWETFNRGECSLTVEQRAWKDENCPCFVLKSSGKGGGKNIACSTDCPQ